MKKINLFLIGLLLVGGFFGALPALATPPPDCTDVQNDPGISTCTCTCTADSTFLACLNASSGAVVPSPNSCPDMLQGRRVIARGDWLVVDNPSTISGGFEENRKVYSTKEGSSNTTIELSGNPKSTYQSDVPCSPSQGSTFPQHTRMAHLFDTPNAMMVTIRSDESAVKSNCQSIVAGQPNMLVVVQDEVTPSNETVTSMDNEKNPKWNQVAVADFDYDGFDDLFYLIPDAAQIYSAVDTSDPTQAVTHFPEFSFSDIRAPLNEPTTGDFNGDGILEVAWVGGDFPHRNGNLTVFFVSV
jgi:hypothetical protein